MPSVNIDNRNIRTDSPEYKKLYPKLAQIVGDQLTRTLPDVNVSPKNNLNLAASVHKGQTDFAKHYLMPALKTIGAFNPATAIPMAGMELHSAYNMPESDNYNDKTGAWVNAGLEMLPLGVGKALDLAAPAIRRSQLVNRVKNVLNKASKEFNGTVSEDYFQAPDKWYRITETPEVEGIREAGRNITTSDLAELKNLNIDNFRRAIINNKLKAVDGGWAINKQAKFNLIKNGSAHGNTSQAALGEKWRGSVASSKLFPQVVLEGQGVNKVRASFDPIKRIHLNRRTFIEQPWDNLPIGTRLGFKTNEMPIENLKAFQKQNNGRYSFSNVLPYKKAEIPAFKSQVIPTKINAFK